MEDPKWKGKDLTAVYEVQKPLPPPRLLGYVSAVDGTEYDVKVDADGKEHVTEKVKVEVPPIKPAPPVHPITPPVPPTPPVSHKV
jgi:hypothetical protein